MNEVATKTEHPLVKLQNQLELRTGEIQRALPDHIPAARFTRVVLTAVQMNPALLEADRPTLLTSAMRAAHDGLMPDGREGALVIYNTKIKVNGQDRWIDAVQWMPMIAGLRKKVRNSGEIATWDVNVVYQKDEFLYETGFDVIFKHKPYLGADSPGEVIAAYSVATMKTGEKSIEVMSRFEIDRIRRLSKAADTPKGPWVMHFAEMAKKTVARRHSKVLPMSTDLDDLVRADDALYDFEGASDKKQPAKRPQLSDFTTIECGKPSEQKRGPQIEVPQEPIEEQAVPQAETAHDQQTGEVLEAEPVELSAADAYELGRKACLEGKPRRVPKEIAEASESYEDAWLAGWNETDAEKAAAKKK